MTPNKLYIAATAARDALQQNYIDGTPTDGEALKLIESTAIFR